MLSLSRKMPTELLADVAKRASDRRLNLKLTQDGLANRSGVSLGSLKRFERTGEISFLGLLKIAFALDCLKEFEALFAGPMPIKNLSDLLKVPRKRKRGSIK